jgi:phosphate transport system substrate-binding protein
MVNLKDAKITSLRLDTLTLSKILNGGIKTWNHSEIAALNPGAKLPTTAITVVSRADSSGSTGNLKSYLYQNLTGTERSKWTNGGQTQQDEFARGGIGMSGSPALVKKVGEVPGAIGYADLSDVTTAVSIVTMKNVAGGWVKPSASAASLYVKAAGVLLPSTYTDAGTAPNQKVTVNGGIYNVDFTKSVSGAYQLTFITYMVAKKGMGADYNTRVMKYANYVLTKCSATPASIQATGYTSVGTALITAAKLQVAKIDD